MPWEIILGAIGGSSVTVIIVVVLGLIFAQRVIEQVVESGARRFESTLMRAEEAYKNALEMGTQIDIHLREKRITVYEELWQKTELLPKWPRADDVTYEKLRELSQELRDWYFRKGGIYLSTDARVAYGAVQETIGKVLKEKSSGVIADEHYDKVRDKCSALRTEMTKDILSRKGAPLLP